MEMAAGDLAGGTPPLLLSQPCSPPLYFPSASASIRSGEVHRQDPWGAAREAIPLSPSLSSTTHRVTRAVATHRHKEELVVGILLQLRCMSSTKLSPASTCPNQLVTGILQQQLAFKVHVEYPTYSCRSRHQGPHGFHNEGRVPVVRGDGDGPLHRLAGIGGDGGVILVHPRPRRHLNMAANSQ
jgi:hypothetical protein